MSDNKRMVKIENAPLNVGDTVVCKRMSDDLEGPSSEKKIKNTPGKVEGVSVFMGQKIYKVRWKIGSTLGLIDGKECKSCHKEYPSDVEFCENEECPESVESGNPKKLDWIDEWWKIDWVGDNNDQISEKYYVTNKKKFLSENNGPARQFVNLSKFYNIGTISKFFEVLRKSGVINMYQSPQYLYLGSNRIEHEHKYSDIGEDRQQYFDEMVGMADEVFSVMIRGAEKQLKDTDIHDEENDFSDYSRRIERIIKKDSVELFKLWTNIKGGPQKMK